MNPARDGPRGYEGREKGFLDWTVAACLPHWGQRLFWDLTCDEERMTHTAYMCVI